MSSITELLFAPRKAMPTKADRIAHCESKAKYCRGKSESLADSQMAEYYKGLEDFWTGHAKLIKGKGY